MANCSICGKRMGMFEGVTLSNSTPELSKTSVCGHCNGIVRRFKEGDLSQAIEIEKMKNSTDDPHIRAYLTSLINPDDKERVNLQLENDRKKEALQLLIQEFDDKISKNENLIMSTTGYNFEQFNIVKYDGIISGESVIGTGMFSEISASVSDFTGSFSNTFADKIKQAEEQALYNLKRSCYIKNCNAIIGIKLNYLTFSNNMIGVVANGTAVIIERI